MGKARMMTTTESADRAAKMFTTNAGILSIIGDGFWAEPDSDTVMVVGYRNNRDATITATAINEAIGSLKANGYKVRQTSPDVIRVRR